jgi:hypothetical protein
MHLYIISRFPICEVGRKRGASLPRTLRYLLIIVWLSVAAIQNAATQTSDADKQAAALAQAQSALQTAQKQLSSIGNLQFSLKEKSGEIAHALDGSKPTPEPIYLELKNPPDKLIANYRFQGDNNLHPLAKGGVSLKVPIPSNVDMVLVDLTWCGGGCVTPTATQPPPYTCPQSKVGGTLDVSATARGQGVSAEKETKSDQHKSSSVTGGDCQETVVFLRELIVPDGELQGTLLPAFIFSVTGLEISEALLEQSKSPKSPTYVLNGTPIRELFAQDGTISRVNDVASQQSFTVRESLFGWSSVERFRIERYSAAEACRPYSSEDSEFIDVNRPGITPPDLAKDNGIYVAPSKVYDTFTLRQMLATTASQLAAISGFSQANITSAYGTLQGITRDTSFISAQVTTVPTPAVSSVLANGTTGTNTSANTLTLANGATGTSTVITCPPGTLPGIGTSGVPACTPLTSTVTGFPNGGTSNVNTSQLNATSGLNLSNTGTQTSNQSNTVTTTSGGQAGTVAPIPVSNPIAAPTNVGISASDMLTEQVQLNSQITTLRLLLQGAVSDQYLTRNSLAIASRQQTTVGFSVSLNPPQRFRHAVAEVRVWIDSPLGIDPVSVMNLLPADKTYNVAKITSHQSQFGAGAVVDMVNVGVNTGKSKDRLYLAKEADTVALQFPRDKPEWPQGADPVARSTQGHIRDFFHEMVIWQSLKDVCGDPPNINDNSLIFGWQFRPVLGSDYVEAGQRTVYAQLALPAGLGEQFAPLVHVQTRWRQYDEKRQVVGAVYEGSCSISENPTPITVLSPLRVHSASWTDMGSGLLKVSAQGNFFSSGFSVLSGPNTISPSTFDGKSVQLFANATNLLIYDDLKLLAEDGRTTEIGMRSNLGPESCGISSSSLRATPLPDGNSLVRATLSSGPNFSLTVDRSPRPLFLIGTQVYGLHETPFIGSAGVLDGCAPIPPAGHGVDCVYHFIAQTDALRSAETFTVRDLSWREFKKVGPIVFDPSFTILSLLGTKPSGSTATCPSIVASPAPNCTPPLLFSIGGFQFDEIASPAKWNCTNAGCFEVYEGLNKFNLTGANFQVISKTAAVIELTPLAPPPAVAYDYKSLRLIWHPLIGNAVEWDLSVPQEAKVPITASAILNVGDSTQIVFSGVDISITPVPALNLTFDGAAVPLATYKYDASKKTLTVSITTAMTAKPGHKEMTLSYSAVPAPGQPPKPIQLQLPFEVTRR